MLVTGIDALLEEEICKGLSGGVPLQGFRFHMFQLQRRQNTRGSDEASWLDIKGDVQKVKNQAGPELQNGCLQSVASFQHSAAELKVAGMIFMDLVDEMVMEIGSMWSVQLAHYSLAGLSPVQQASERHKSGLSTPADCAVTSTPARIRCDFLLSLQ